MLISKEKTFAIIVALVVVAVLLYGAFFVRKVPMANAPEVKQGAKQEVGTAKPAAGSSLGATILDQAKNPIQNKVPEASPKVNPIQGIYKNPFE